MAELCREYRVSRKTGYKWVQRFLEGGIPALMDRSRAPLTRPNAVDDAMVDAIVAMKKRHPSWGPKKLRSLLYRDEPTLSWPSEATVARILKRRGLVAQKRRRRRTPVSEHPLAAAHEPNHVWCTDFKGKFRVGQRYCHPLTISDARSRFVLCCSDTGGERFEPTRDAFERTFREYGVPLRMRSDNGRPFASSAVGGLSRLSVWWLKLGILPERTRPGHPQDNGMHERMHRTLKADTAKPPRSTLELQQEAFDTWRDEFNHHRPHEALGMKTPAEVYQASPRPFPEEVGDPDYPDYFEVRRIKARGGFLFHKQELHLAAVLRGEAIGLEPIDDGLWQVWFGPIYLGLLTELGRNKSKFTPNIPYENQREPATSAP